MTTTIRRRGVSARTVFLAIAASALVGACAGAAASPSPSGTATPSAAQSGIQGRAVAGPTCPVETVPPDPQCAARPVTGAVLIVRDGSGREVARATTDADGSYVVSLPPGSYTVDPQQVEGYLMKAETATVQVPAGGFAQLDWAYDTGIR